MKEWKTGIMLTRNIIKSKADEDKKQLFRIEYIVCVCYTLTVDIL